ncbi:family 2 glycosyl transferase [Marivirga harenae]|uniref:family 2 glycosyl transferase n=1 Tax=Marivirga harenae TaxID=2010992 RepID=UPI0026E0A00E|nr:family 2 glycosyl transferase [Marivirga harenae]WKV14097.1 family 2 glycosyl transferase [Marivirga harenae]
MPVYKENDLLPTLGALIECEKTQFPVEIIFVINHPENSKPQEKEKSLRSVVQIEEFVKNHNCELTFHIIKAYDLPSKKAGVGLARKIGMDEAAFRLNSINQDGVILCFDADSQCTPNYLREVEKHFLEYSNCNGASIHYEHPLYLENGKLNDAIVLYELHLRYYIQALKYTGYPFAFHTIGSSMAVRSTVYQKQGGMNQRKAGEDFYFLHKIIPLGDFHNISTTKVIPSARISDRVPFGTGRAMKEHQDQTKDLELSYDFGSFSVIKSFLEEIERETTENLPNTVIKFLRENNFLSELEKIQSQSKNANHFKERFFEWFNGFKMLKLVHFLRDNYFPEKPLILDANQLLKEIGIIHQTELSALELLERYRNLDKECTGFKQ